MEVGILNGDFKDYYEYVNHLLIDNQITEVFFANFELCYIFLYVAG
jgi:hypothetical protein